MSTDLLLPILIFAAAVLYSAVGHAGASGYLAAMALAGVAPSVMKPTALALNVLVATIATARYVHAGLFEWRRFYPFALASVPCAFLGGALQLPTEIYRPVVGLVLLAASVQLARSALGRRSEASEPQRPVRLVPGLIAGAGIGLLAGLTGTGGGIFLSPLLLLAGWARTRAASGIAAAFILVNSLAGLAGASLTAASLPAELPIWLVLAGAGALVGTTLGVRILPIAGLRLVLAAVLLVAGLKLVLS